MKAFLLLSFVLVGSPLLASTPVAYVYIQETDGPVSVYSAASDGKLTQIKGSPFPLPVGGSLLGISGTHLITLNTLSVYSYEVSSTGEIGKRVSEIEPLKYSTCGPLTLIGGAVLEGQFVYVSVEGYSSGGGTPTYCQFLQTYEIGSLLTFKGATTSPEYLDAGRDMPTILGNKEYAFSPGPSLLSFSRESTGTLSLDTGAWNEPGPAPGYTFADFYGEFAADPTNHLAMGVQWSGPDGSVLEQLASYTVNNQDTATTTNVSESMPTLAYGWGGLMAMNPAGTILAVATGTGTQFFHFNGAEPITPFTEGVIGISGFITAMAWDNDGHLFALNGATGRLHVYAVTSTTAKEISGSPYKPPFKSTAHQRIAVHSN